MDEVPDRRPLYRSPIAIGLGFIVAGALGLTVGWLLFPESNLLGGLALIFAPLLWIGVAVLVGDLLRRGLSALGRRGQP